MYFVKSLIQKLESLLELGGTKKEIILLFISAISLLVSILNLIPLPFDAAWISILLCGIPIILEAIIGLVTAFDIKADVLVSIALIASIFIGEDFAAGEVAFIMQLGALLEDLTVSKARAGIEKLVQLTPQTARIINGTSEKTVAATEVKVGDILRVLPGETIPTDGIITLGETSINQAVITGESLPIDKSVGDEVSSGTVNQFGSFEMKALKEVKDSSIQRMIDLVQSASADKAKIVGIADKWATAIVLIALSSSLITWIITGKIIRAVTILVVFCPCALVLATPTAIMAAIGNATKHGFLVREGDALERLAKVNKITFDKTGTLTYGTPEVISVKTVNNTYSEDMIYKLAASIEQFSEHPLGKAILHCYKENSKDTLLQAEQFQMTPGYGVSALINNNKIIAGNKKILSKNNITIPESILLETEKYLTEGATVIFIAENNILIGYIVLSDTIRLESSSMINKLNTLSVQPVLLTGDNENTANTIATKLNIKEVHANCLPEDKLNWIDKYQKQHDYICMIGDGINDAPALKKANIGIAMGGIGSDIAVDAADIVLIDDEIKELPHLLSLSKKMMFTIKCNLTFSMILNFVAIILAMTGILNPIVGALVHNLGSVLVIANSALLLKVKSH